MRVRIWALFVPIAVALLAVPASADSFFFNTGIPDGKMATASRPGSTGIPEIESADDFVLTSPTNLTSATFTGLIPTGASLSSITDVRVEIYRVFPADSDVGRTSGAPDFSTPQVPTRVNSPSDVAFDERSASEKTLTFTAGNTGFFGPTFTAANSVLNGINPKPNNQTGGEGSVTGQPITFNVDLSKQPFSLPADHYFFVPQVQLSDGNFFWLSAARPIVSPGTSFPAGFTDLQEWIRNEPLQPDWLRVGTDIVGTLGPGGSPAPTFNAAFSLSGEIVPEPTSLIMLALGGAAALATGWARRHSRLAKGPACG